MYNDNNTRTENGLYFSNTTRKGNSKFLNSMIEKEIRDRENDRRLLDKINECGNNKLLIKEASNQRVNGFPFKYDDSFSELDKKSYFYGYFVHGMRQLYAKLYKIDNDESLSREDRDKLIEQVGYREYHYGIPEEFIGSMFNSFKPYRNGYNRGKKEAEECGIERHIRR